MSEQLPASAASATPSASRTPYESLTLQQLPPELHPAEPTACQTCNAALWHATAKELRCFCRAMRVLVWTTKEPETLTLCDGLAFEAEQ